MFSLCSDDSACEVIVGETGLVVKAAGWSAQ